MSCACWCTRLRREGPQAVHDGDAPYHLRLIGTEVFPTGVLRVIYPPAEAPAKV